MNKLVNLWLTAVDSYMNSIEFGFFLLGLIDSDGCVTVRWSKDAALGPSIVITQRKDFELLVYCRQRLDIAYGRKQRGRKPKENGNFSVAKGIERVRTTGLILLFRDPNDLNSCYLLTSRSLDALIVREMVFSDTKERKEPVVRGYFLCLREGLHYGKSTAFKNPRTTTEETLKLPPNSSLIYQHVADLKLDFYKTNIDTRIEKVSNNLQKFDSTYCPDPYQILGFFMGDGGFHVVWGQRSISVVLTFSGDAKSAQALEIYMACLMQDGVYRKASVGRRRDSSRIIVSGTKSILKAKEFFDKVNLPPSTKGERVQKLFETAVLLDTLVPDTKGRKNPSAVRNKIWTKKQKSDLKRLIKETWDLNPSGPNRKFSDPDSYYLDVLDRKQKGTLSIR
jgi:hypothetical protein